MRTSGLPRDESARLDTLHALGILDTEAEERFDRYTRIARNLFDVPIALVSLVDQDRQWFKSRQGLTVNQNNGQRSFCGQSVLDDRILIVNNAAEDERFADNPLVTGDLHIRFYAGCPVRAANGHTLGTVCILDHRPRTLSEAQIQLLQDLARMVENEFTAIDKATSDDLTGLSNRRGFTAIAEHSLRSHRGGTKWVYLLLFELSDLKRLRDEWGRAEGHGAVCDFARTLLEMFQSVDVIARIADDQFAVLGSGPREDCAMGPTLAFAEAMAAVNTSAGPSRSIQFDVVTVLRRSTSRGDVDGWLQEADKRLRRLKRDRV